MPELDSDGVAAHAPDCGCLDCYTTAGINVSSVWAPPPGRQATGGAASVEEVIQGHVLEVLASLKAESVSCVITSPPYWSLRKYDAPDVVWGGEPGCEHEWTSTSKDGAVEAYEGAGRWQHADHSRDETPGDWGRVTQGSGLCRKCGAFLGQYGLEPTPELYVEHTLQVLAAIKRALRPDGVLWLNLGDGYSHGGQGARDAERWPKQSRNDHMPAEHSKKNTGLKPKDLVLMPFRVALAAQADGWWVRSVIIWSKPNAMPESTKDRPTTAHEYVLMLTKSARYWYDQEAVRESATGQNHHDLTGQGYRAPGQTQQSGNRQSSGNKERKHRGDHGGNPDLANAHQGFGFPWEARSSGGRNLRSVWEFPTAQTPEAHFATFPEELPARCIRASCPKDGLVLDPFCGIGTTGVVAKRLGRRFIGIELSEKYAAMARDKLRVWWRKTNLAETAAPEGQAVLPLEAP